jgi:phosphatidylserine/phosphatidylglycerophosphate/cardiolipin synthase-like enzyme
MAGEFQVSGQNAAALLTLKLHRGDGMTLIAMNWKIGKPPQDFVGFAIEYKEPTGGGGIRMHHKFVVIDFDKPTARVYLGSYNFSSPADIKNGGKPASHPRPPNRSLVRR